MDPKVDFSRLSASESRAGQLIGPSLYSVLNQAVMYMSTYISKGLFEKFFIENEIKTNKQTNRPSDTELHVVTTESSFSSYHSFKDNYWYVFFQLYL